MSTRTKRSPRSSACSRCRRSSPFATAGRSTASSARSPRAQIKSFIDRLLGDGLRQSADLRDLIESGDQLLDAGDLQGAAEAFAAVLQQDRSSGEALAGLAQCYLKSGDVDRARQTLALVTPEKRELARVLSVMAGIDLAAKAGAHGDLRTLRVRIASNAKDHEVRFDLAVALAAAGKSRKPSISCLN